MRSFENKIFYDAPRKAKEIVKDHKMAVGSHYIS